MAVPKATSTLKQGMKAAWGIAVKGIRRTDDPEAAALCWEVLTRYGAVR